LTTETTLRTTGGFWDTTTHTGITIVTRQEKWNPWSSFPMKTPSDSSKRRSGNTLRKVKTSPTGRIRIGVESLDEFFSRMRTNARALDRGEKLTPGLSLMFEDPADLLEVITPARLRLLEAIGNKTVSLFALATSLARDPSAVRRDVTLLESKHLVRTRKIPNPGHGMQTVVEKAAATITLAATV
jgi:predicted transcriptional regulator